MSNILISKEQTQKHNIVARNVSVMGKSDLMLVCRDSLEQVLGGKSGLGIRPLEDRCYSFEMKNAGGMVRKMLDLKSPYTGVTYEIYTSPVFEDIDFTGRLKDHHPPYIEKDNGLAEAHLLTTVLLSNVIHFKVHIIMEESLDEEDAFPVHTNTSSIEKNSDTIGPDDLIEVPRKIFGYPTNISNEKVAVPKGGFIMYDGDYPVAELARDGIYIHHDIFRGGDIHGVYIYREILLFMQKMLIAEDIDETYNNYISTTNMQRWVATSEKQVTMSVNRLHSEVMSLEEHVVKLQQQIRKKQRAIQVKTEMATSLESRSGARAIEFEAEYNKILAMDKVVAVRVYHDHFEIDTASLVMKTTTDQRKFDIGSYTISVSYLEGNTHFRSHRVVSGSRHHPHIKDRICYGDYSGKLDSYAIKGQYYYGIQYAIQFLETCNPNSAFPENKLENWDIYEIKV